MTRAWATRDSRYFVQVRLDGRESWSFLVTDATNVWAATLDSTGITDLAGEDDVGDFCQHTREVLLQEEPSTSFVTEVEVRPEEGIAELSWKRAINDDSYYLIGTISLCALDEPSEAVRKVWLEMIRSSERSNVEKREVERRNELLTRELAQCRKLVENRDADMAECENRLLTKFAMVLNEKKAEIRRLRGMEDKNVSVMSENENDSRTDDEKASSSGGSMNNDDSTDATRDEEDLYIPRVKTSRR